MWMLQYVDSMTKVYKPFPSKVFQSTVLERFAPENWNFFVFWVCMKVSRSSITVH